tara:strand:- start:26 stop:385 length:360 start_codon:yes stop_codon:yes gene_type:complete
MKRTLLALAILFNIGVSGQGLTIPDDKVLHFGGSYAIASTTTQFAQWKGATPKQAFWIGFGLSMGVGIAKEVYDIKHGTPVWTDLAANFAGASIGAFTTITLEISKTGVSFRKKNRDTP